MPTKNSQKKQKSLKLKCPDCSVLVTVPANKLIEGEEIGCTACGSELVLGRESESDHGEKHWQLLYVADDLEGDTA